MADRLVLHVGLMKSGTTFIQGRCNANRKKLAAQGILFPGPTWARHSRGVTDFLGKSHAKPGSWASLRDEIHAHPGTAIISMEYLGPIRQERIDKMAAEFPDTELVVVVTLRDLGRGVPAMWQESVKNRATWTWDEFVHGVKQQRQDQAGRHFWNQQDAATILGRWVEGVGADHVVVVTVPPPGAPSHLLWDRFSEAAGIGPDEWNEAPRANESLGAASAVLMRRLNGELQDLDRNTYKNRVKALAKHTLVNRKADEDAIGFTVPDWLRQRAHEANQRIADLGVRVIGDLSDLEPLDVRGVDPMGVTPEQELDSAVAGLAAMLREGDRALRHRGAAGLSSVPATNAPGKKAPAGDGQGAEGAGTKVLGKWLSLARGGKKQA